MMKQNWKSLAACVMVVSLCVGGACASSSVKSAEFNANKVIYNGVELDLSEQPMISVVKEDEVYFSNYMPLRAVLEKMGYTVDWDDENSTVIVADGDWYKPDDIYSDGATLREYITDSGINFDKTYNAGLLGIVREMCAEAGDEGFISRLPEDILIVLMLNDFAGFAAGYNSLFGDLWYEIFTP